MSLASSESFNLVEQQKEAVKHTIKELAKNEKVRQKWLDTAKTNSRRVELETRYEIERERDKQKLAQMVGDFRIVMKYTEEGKMETLAKQRNESRPRVFNPIKTMDTDRFVGMQTLSECLFHKKRIDLFDTMDRRAIARANAKTFDYYDEKRKVNLLRDKRDILKEMVAIQSKEYYTHLGGGGGGGSSRSTYSGAGTGAGGGGGGRFSSARSDASGESYATFASNSSRANAAARTRSNPKVPALKLRG